MSSPSVLLQMPRIRELQLSDISYKYFSTAFHPHPPPKLPNQMRLALPLLSLHRSRPQPLPPPHRPLLLLQAAPLFHRPVRLHRPVQFHRLVRLHRLVLLLLPMATVLLWRPPTMIRQLAVHLLLQAPVGPSLACLSAARLLSLQLSVHLLFCNEVFRTVHLT